MELMTVGDMHITPEINLLAEALVEAQDKLPAIKKNREAWSYKYADLNAILEQVTPVLKEVGLSIFQSIGTEGGKATIRTILLHVSGQMIVTGSFQIPGDTGGKMSELQGLGSAITYARRYQLSPAIGVVTEDDNDGKGTEEVPLKTPEKAPEKPQEGAPQGGEKPTGKDASPKTVGLVKALMAGLKIIDESKMCVKATRILGLPIEKTLSSLEEMKQSQASDVIKALKEEGTKMLEAGEIPEEVSDIEPF